MSDPMNSARVNDSVAALRASNPDSPRSAAGGEPDSDNARNAALLYDKLEQKVLALYYGDLAG